MVSFSNQALKNVPRTYQIDLLEKQIYFLPLFDPSSSIDVAVTAPAKADEIGAGLKDIGF